MISPDAVLLAEIIDSHATLNRKRLSFLADRDESSISRYLSGDQTIPSFVLRAAFEETHDRRLVQLVSGRVPLCLGYAHGIIIAAPAQPSQQPQPAPPRIPPLGELLPRTCDAVKKCAASVEYIAKIVADSRVDTSDATAIEDFKRHATEAIKQLSLTLAGLEAHQRSATNAKAVPQ